MKGEGWMANRMLSPEPYDGGGFVRTWTPEELAKLKREIGQEASKLPSLPSKRVYLAGDMSTHWRETVKARLREAGAEVWVPADNPQQSAARYVPADLDMARQADAVLAYLTNSHSGLGTSAEMGAAYAEGKPIWLVWAKGSEVYPFTAAMAYRIFVEDLDAAVESLLKYVKEGVL